MVRQGLTNNDLANLLGVTERGIRDRINGYISWKWLEVTKIKSRYFRDYDIEELFENTKQVS